MMSPIKNYSSLNPLHWAGLAIIIMACAIASFHPLDFKSYLLHQSGTLLGVIALFVLCCQHKVSRTGFVLTVMFILLHIVGAHYLYSFVPYNEWIKQLFHFDLNHYFGWTRNMYDRLVHFAYGLLLYKIAADVFARSFPAKRRLGIALLALQFIMASSMVYELIEWVLAVGLSPEQAENYNGQQGDLWDAQKDMALATLGTLCAMIIEYIYLRLKG